MIPSFIAERLGFERKVFNELATSVQTRLTLEAGLSLFSCLLFGISGGYVAYLETYSKLFAWPMAITIGLAVFVFALNIQRLFITAGGFGLSRPLRKNAVDLPSGETYRTDAIAFWRPDQLRLFCTFLLAVLFSQSLLLLLNSKSLNKQIPDIIEARVSAFEQDQTALVQEDRGRLVIRQRASLEKLAQTDFDLGLLGVEPIPPAPSKPAPAPNALPADGSTFDTASPVVDQVAESVASRPHKALVIGVQKYLYEQSLNNPTRDANDMTRALTELGYQVTTVTDDKTTSATLQVEIDRYVKSLEPGDVSVFYFSGHGYMHQGNNFLAAADAGGPKAIDINLNQLIEDISRRSPRASILLLDACSSWPKGADRNGLGHLNQDIKGTLVAYAASPGQTAIDLPRGQNGLFTQKLLNNLRNPESITAIMVKVRKEVVEYAERSNKPQTPYVIDVLMDVVSIRGGQSSPVPRLAQSTVKPEVTVNKVPTLADEDAKDPCTTQNVQDVPCLLADIELTAARIARLDSVITERQPVLVKDYRESLNQSGHLADRFRMQWQHTVESVLASVVFVLLLWVGDLVRDLKPFALRHYERERYGQARRLVRNDYEDHSRLTRSMLEQFEGYVRDNRERIPVWDTEEEFFYEKEIRRPDHRDLLNSLETDSVLDLIEELGGTAAPA